MPVGMLHVCMDMFCKHMTYAVCNVQNTIVTCYRCCCKDKEEGAQSHG